MDIRRYESVIADFAIGALFLAVSLSVEADFIRWTAQGDVSGPPPPVLSSILEIGDTVSIDAYLDDAALDALPGDPERGEYEVVKFNA